MKRGEIVLVAVPDAYGKPRPALILQADYFDEHPSVTIALLTSHLQPTPLFRYQVEPDSANGLTVPSQVQIDKLMTIPRDKCRETIGQLSSRQMSEITRLVAFWLGVG